ncbi:hypothetical protein GCM10027416_24050 [Okibacterium endophyticum]
MTHSPYVLVFAALGPIVAIGGVIDGRWGSKRRLRRDTREFERQCERVADQIACRHTVERRQRGSLTPRISVLLDRDDRGARTARWRAPVGTRTVIVVGEGQQPSRIRVDGAVTEQTRRLTLQAAVVSGVPVELDSARGIGVAGPTVLGRAVARGLLLQLCERMHPGVAHVVVPAGSAWSWAAELPHAMAAGSPEVVVRVVDAERRDVTAASPGGHPPAGTDAVATPATETAPAGIAGGETGGTEVVIAIDENVERIPPRCAAVIDVTGADSAVLHEASALPIAVDLVTEAQASARAAELTSHARSLGLIGSRAHLARSVAYNDAAAAALATPSPGGERGLQAVVGIGERGAVALDIVADGPHAIVGGTTGSGKSELLITWAASIADRYPPEKATLLLVDFKGGAAFAPLTGLPHVVGVITDLDQAEATRALESLKAEVRHREHVLREAGVRDISEAGDRLPRLVIIVDEFAAMLDGFAELHTVFTDIAARGRSLGMHLILCTQRPAGVVRESLMANCGLRLSLRVNNRADSVSVVGTDAAARLSATIPGRVVIAEDDGTTIAQVATVTSVELTRIATRWSDPRRRVRRPWLDPLPETVDLGSLHNAGDHTTGYAFGLSDLPDQQRQATARYQPHSDGSVLVLGTARTGKTTVLDTLERSMADTLTVVRIGDHDERTWDEVSRLAIGIRRDTLPASGTVLLIDDLDAVCARIDDDYATELRDGVVRLLREGPGRRLWVIVTANRLSGPLTQLSSFAGSVLMLKQANRQEHSGAGGDPRFWNENRRRGSAIWQGRETQVARVAASTLHPPREADPEGFEPEVFDERAAAVTVIVSRYARERVASLHRRHPDRAVRVAGLAEAGAQQPGRLTVDSLDLQRGPVVMVGDTEQWQAQWALLTALRPSAHLVFEGCTPAEFRAITRIRDLPPLLAPIRGRAWCLDPGGKVTRVSLAP